MIFFPILPGTAPPTNPSPAKSLKPKPKATGLARMPITTYYVLRILESYYNKSFFKT